MRLLKRLAVVLILLIVVPLVLGLLGTLIPHPFTDAQPTDAPLSERILVVSNTIHTDIAIPLDAKSLEAFGFLADTLPVTHPDARWLLIGWGGRSFYLETPNLTDIKPGPTFRALTVDSSVMHVDVLGEIDQTNPAIMAVPISDVAYANLLSTISASFTRKDGKVLPIDGYAFGPSDKFYEGEGSFNALLGCNVWTSRILRSAGIRTGLWNPLPISLTTSLRWFNADQLKATAPQPSS
jgi:uncharacterized protein (TIGR02117 family)